MWLSVDPFAERSPNESGYIYTSNNPVIYVDPDGKFKIPIHQEITRIAMQSVSGLGNYAKLDIVLGVGYRADIIGGFSDLHFDGRANFKQIKNTWTQLNKDINSINYGSFNKEQGGLDAITLGKRLHTVQDFYSHSNYVELYIEYYKSANNGAMPDDIPTYDEGVKIEGFKALMERTTYDENGNYQGLHTGEFNLEDNEFWDINPFSENHTGANSHKHMNKDEANTPAGKLAKKVAIEHTKKILKNIVEE